MLMNLIIVLIAFLSGSIMYSYLLPLLLLKKDIRLLHTDANPGGANAFRLQKSLGIFCIICDILKGFVPVLLGLSVIGLDSLWTLLLILAPILGHAFSPMLGGKGGKCIAVTFGSLLGLVPRNYIVLLLALIFIIYSCILIIYPCSTRVILTMVTFVLTSWFFTTHTFIHYSIILIALLIIYKHLKAPDPGPFHITFLFHRLLSSEETEAKTESDPIHSTSFKD